VANASVTTYIAQAGYILCNLPAKLTFHDVITVDNLRYAAKLVFTELAGLCTSFDTRFFQNLFRGIFTYTDNISQRNPYRFVIGNINTNYTWQISSFSYPVIR